jgi:hypothetical protein
VHGLWTFCLLVLALFFFVESQIKRLCEVWGVMSFQGLQPFRVDLGTIITERATGDYPAYVLCSVGARGNSAARLCVCMCADMLVCVDRCHRRMMRALFVHARVVVGVLFVVVAV